VKLAARSINSAVSQSQTYAAFVLDFDGNNSLLLRRKGAA
jgi:hypothetical protein